MKRLAVLLAIGLGPLFAGCASVPKSVVLAPVGPAPELQPSTSAQEGSLQVFSARQLHEPINLDGEVFVEGNPLGSGAYELAHTDYSIYTQDGRFVSNVKNAQGINDPIPAVVTLPAGSYTIRAEARDYGKVVVPVVIRPSEATVVHLQRNWKPVEAQEKPTDFVWLADRAVGWRAR